MTNRRPDAGSGDARPPCDCRRSEAESAGRAHRDLGWGHHSCPRHRPFESERYAVEPRADLNRRVAVRFIEVEARRDVRVPGRRRAAPIP